MYSKLVGILVFGVGIYAWIEKDTFTRLSNLSIGVLFDPAFLFLVVGSFVFVIGFCGCVGALRENTNLLFGVSFHFVSSLLTVYRIFLNMAFKGYLTNSNLTLKNYLNIRTELRFLQKFLFWTLIVYIKFLTTY